MQFPRKTTCGYFVTSFLTRPTSARMSEVVRRRWRAQRKQTRGRPASGRTVWSMSRLWWVRLYIRNTEYIWVITTKSRNDWVFGDGENSIYSLFTWCDIITLQHVFRYTPVTTATGLPRSHHHIFFQTVSWYFSTRTDSQLKHLCIYWCCHLHIIRFNHPDL